jgi:superfamily II DNA or RNA helicase
MFVFIQSLEFMNRSQLSGGGINLRGILAHNCVGKSPGAKIMEDFYWREKARGLPVPHILGLSASPVMKSKYQSPKKIEEVLDAICRTPQRHRAELMEHVNMPEFRQILYVETLSDSELQGWSRALHSLHKTYSEYDMNKDPYIIQLRADESERSQRTLTKVLMNQKTWCFRQLKTLYTTSLVIFRELGAWAVDYYISQVVKRVTRLVSLGSSYLEDWTAPEQRHLCDILEPLDSVCNTHKILLDASTVSDKVQRFIDALPRDETLAGIIFVDRRATVAVLAHILSVHPQTRSQFRVGTVVGSSHNILKSSNICELVDREEQGQTLHKFRSAKLDLVIATTVLEEGIDVPACNLVLCFDEPANLKSFVQRRGRARTKKSQLVLMQSSDSDKLSQWQELELEMKRIYADDMRELQVVIDLEHLEEHDEREFRVESTG